MKLLPRYFGRATGRHRSGRVPGPIVAQQLIHCTQCGGLAAATVHGALLRCTEGHEIGGES